MNFLKKTTKKKQLKTPEKVFHTNLVVVFLQAEELKRTCNDFLHNSSEFTKIADSFIMIFDAVSQEVEKEKISAIG